MSTFHVTLDIGDLYGDRWESVTALVDTGSSYSTIPRQVLDRLGIIPSDRMPFDLANGQVVESDLGEARARITVPGAGLRNRATVVIFGEPGEPTLLGAHTLEAWGLGVDPLNERLIPVHGLRMSARP